MSTEASWWSRGGFVLLAVVGTALRSGAAHAGACCVGTTTTVPTRLGPCETWLAGTGLTMEHSALRWDGAGAVQTSSLMERAAVATAAFGYRWDRKGQVMATVPVRATHKASPTLATSGGGVGDARVDVAWSPVEERVSMTGPSPPVPYLVLGARLPTGRAWDDSQDPLLSDVTGRDGPAGHVLLQVERMSDRVPWSVGVDTELEIAHGRVDPSFLASGAVGRTIGRDWSVNGLLQHREAFQGGRSSVTSAGAQVTVGRSRRWRGWVGVTQDLPVRLLGNDRMVVTRAGGGVAWVR